MEIEIVASIKVTGLKPNEKVSYKGTLQSGDIFVIIEPDGDYSKSKVFFKEPQREIIEVKVLSIQRLKDGGTTNIVTERGTFHFPSSFKSTELFPATFSEAGNNIKELEK